jgi:hypothetical protein
MNPIPFIRLSLKGDMADHETVSQGQAVEEYTYHATEDQTLSEAVIHAVGDFTGQEMAVMGKDQSHGRLNVLYENINPDALNSLFQTEERQSSITGRVEFSYCGCNVTVHSTGLISVSDR